jgi:hypothetical protein
MCGGQEGSWIVQPGRPACINPVCGGDGGQYFVCVVARGEGAEAEEGVKKRARAALVCCIGTHVVFMGCVCVGGGNLKYQDAALVLGVHTYNGLLQLLLLQAVHDVQFRTWLL